MKKIFEITKKIADLGFGEKDIHGITTDEEVYIKYTVDDTAIKNKKGYAKAEEYEEFTARPDEDYRKKIHNHTDLAVSGSL